MATLPGAAILKPPKLHHIVVECTAYSSERLSSSELNSRSILTANDLFRKVLHPVMLAIVNPFVSYRSRFLIDLSISTGYFYTVPFLKAHKKQARYNDANDVMVQHRVVEV